MSAGDQMIEAIAEAVAKKLESYIALKQRLMDIKAAAEYLGMTEDALRARAGRDIPCVKLDGRLRFDRLELDRKLIGPLAKASSLSRDIPTRTGRARVFTNSVVLCRL